METLFWSLTFTMQQNMHFNAISYFTTLLNRILAQASFPLAWKEAIVIQISKPSPQTLSNPLIPSHFCPQLIKRNCTNKRIYWYLNFISLLLNSQYGDKKVRCILGLITDAATYSQTNDFDHRRPDHPCNHLTSSNCTRGHRIHQSFINRTSDWISCHSFLISSYKTNFLKFQRNVSNPSLPFLLFNGKSIPMSSTSRSPLSIQSVLAPPQTCN